MQVRKNSFQNREVHLMRKAHYLRENKRAMLPRYIIFFDTEASIEKKENFRFGNKEYPAEIQTLKLGYAEFYDYEKREVIDSISFTEKEEFISFIRKCTLKIKKGKLWVFAHNMD